MERRQLLTFDTLFNKLLDRVTPVNLCKSNNITKENFISNLKLGNQWAWNLTPYLNNLIGSPSHEICIYLDGQLLTIYSPRYKEYKFSQNLSNLKKCVDFLKDFC